MHIRNVILWTFCNNGQFSVIPFFDLQKQPLISFTKWCFSIQQPWQFILAEDIMLGVE